MSQGYLYKGGINSAFVYSSVASPAPAPAPAPTPAPSPPSLDFSQAPNSQYLPIIF